MRLVLALCVVSGLVAQTPAPAPTAETSSQTIEMQIGRSTVIERSNGFKRVSVANGDVADAVAVSSSELLVNAKATGETSLVLWDGKGVRHTYLIRVLPDEAMMNIIRSQLTQEIGPGVSVASQGSSLFLRGTVDSTIMADRAVSIASAYPSGKVVNLLRVTVPPGDPQILLKVRFADVDRSISDQLGVNLFGLNGLKGIGTSTTGQFGQNPTISGLTGGSTATLTDLMNIFFYRPDLNIGAVLRDLEAKNALQILAEPDLLAMSGHPASFLAGGEFPFPTIQGGAAGVGQITIQFKEFGIRLNFVPTVTPRGTVHLEVMPEVSSLDYSNGLTVGGYTVPGISTRRVTTDVELASGQSFAIAGLLNNQLTETVDKMPGIGNIPVLGKLFQSRSTNKSHTELLVIVTPELVNPIPAGDKAPGVHYDKPFLPGAIPPALGNVPSSMNLAQPQVLTVEEMKAILSAQSPAGPQALNVNGVTGQTGNIPAIGPVTPVSPNPNK